MRNSALILGIISTVIWVLPIGPLGILTGFMGIIMSREVYQNKPRLALGLSVFGATMALTDRFGWIFAAMAEFVYEVFKLAS